MKHKAKKGVLSRTNVRAELPFHLFYYVLLGFQILQSQLVGGVAVALPIQDSLIFKSASRFTASGSENLASFMRLPRISTL